MQIKLSYVTCLQEYKIGVDTDRLFVVVHKLEIFLSSVSTSFLFVSQCMFECCVEVSKKSLYSVVWVREVKQLSV